MDTREALLKAVLAAPDDDLPRLVFADWCDENGEAERAEFVRASIELNRRNPDYSFGYGDPPGDSKSLERVLFDLFGKGVHASLQAIVDGPAYWTFARHSRVVRGFVHTVRCTLADWISHGPAVVREHPVAKVNFTTDQHGEIIAPTGDGNFVIAALRDEDSGQGFIPFSLMNFLKLFGGRHSGEYYMIALFDTRDEAESALSSAAILWAKSQSV